MNKENMWIAGHWRDYELLDCSRGEKLERWGDVYLVRPDPQAIWDTPRRNEHWHTRNARYIRSESGGGSWEKDTVPESWEISYGELTFRVRPMNFKHTGLFPEQAANWDWAMRQIRTAGRPIRVLNLFAYTGAATVACLKTGAEVCHVDAAKGMSTTARSLLSGKSAAASVTTLSSWIRLPMVAGRAAKSGSWNRISGPLSRSAPTSSRRNRFSFSSTPIPRASRPRC